MEGNLVVECHAKENEAISPFFRNKSSPEVTRRG